MGKKKNNARKEREKNVILHQTTNNKYRRELKKTHY